MKRTSYALFFALLLVGSFAFTWNFNEPQEEAISSATAVDAEFLFSTEKSTLKEKLGQFLTSKLDQVDRVDALYHPQKEYFYRVYGTQNGQAVTQEVLVSKEMIEQKEFPTLAEMGVEEASMIVFCYWVFDVNDNGVGIISCQVANQGTICGVSPSGGLCVQVRIFPFGQL